MQSPGGSIKTHIKYKNEVHLARLFHDLILLYDLIIVLTLTPVTACPHPFIRLFVNNIMFINRAGYVYYSNNKHNVIHKLLTSPDTPAQVWHLR